MDASIFSFSLHHFRCRSLVKVKTVRLYRIMISNMNIDNDNKNRQSKENVLNGIFLIQLDFLSFKV